jgi:DNA-binding MarR family transcriptional regulator
VLSHQGHLSNTLFPDVSHGGRWNQIRRRFVYREVDERTRAEAAVTNDGNTRDDPGDSISGRSAALFVSQDPSIAQLVTEHGIRVRDFILVSFLSDQGPLSIEQLARILCIEPHDILKSARRLATAGLVVHDSVPVKSDRATRVRLTGRGEDVAASVEREP